MSLNSKTINYEKSLSFGLLLFSLVFINLEALIVQVHKMYVSLTCSPIYGGDLCRHRYLIIPKIISRYFMKQKQAIICIHKRAPLSFSEKQGFLNKRCNIPVRQTPANHLLHSSFQVSFQLRELTLSINGIWYSPGFIFYLPKLKSSVVPEVTHPDQPLLLYLALIKRYKFGILDLVKVTKMEVYKIKLGKKLWGLGHRHPGSLLCLVWPCVPLSLCSVPVGFKPKLPLPCRVAQGFLGC